MHPEALVHSIVEFDNYVTQFNLFHNDMNIPILNFLNLTNIKYKYNDNRYFIDKYRSLNFNEIKDDVFPIYKFFNNINKKKPENLIKFNIGNEFAVNLYKDNKIKYTDIYRIIKKVTSLNLYSSVNTIKDILNYHEELENKLKELKNIN